jgi:type II secretory ATPase GspE/PulE/Tfp pilus assembly ATPase PilB-like protein
VANWASLKTVKFKEKIMTKKSRDTQSLQWFISNDKNLLQAKRQAKALLRKYQKNNPSINQYNLALCQDEIAIKMGYQNWFDFYNQRKKDNENHLYPQFIKDLKNQIVISFENIIAHCLSIEVDYLHFRIKSDSEKIALRQYGQLNYYDPQIMLPVSLDEILNTVVEYYFNKKLVDNLADTKQIQIKLNEQFIDVKLRFQQISCYPPGSYDLVIKLYHEKKELMSLEALGYSPEQIKILSKVAKSREPGMLLVSGQIGSGMQTTLKTILNKAKEQIDENDILTLDEPDIRNNQAIFKDNQDKLILASLHSPNSEYALARMEDFGLSTEGIKNLTVINQRLMPVLCDHCKQPFSLASDKAHPYFSYYEKFQSHYSAKELANIYIKGEGCPKCHYLGYQGKTVCSTVTPSSQINKEEYENDIMPEKEMLDIAIKKMFQGNLSAIDIDEKLCNGKIFNML